MNTYFYKINKILSLPGLADKKYKDLSNYELKRRGFRVIGGDLGDLQFSGYTLDKENNRTILNDPYLVTSCEFSEERQYEVAQDILMNSFESIGLETLEHS